MSSILLSIVFASYDRPECLRSALGAVSAGRFGFRSRIVIDDFSSLNNLEAIQGICRANDFEFYRKQERTGLAKSWNLGIIKSPTRYVIVSVDDVILKMNREWIHRTKELFALGAHLVFLFKKKCWAIDKSIIPTIGWYDERFPFCGYGDGDWYHRAWSLQQQGKLSMYPKFFNSQDDREETDTALHIPHKISEMKEKRTWAHDDEHAASRKFFLQKWEIDRKEVLKHFPRLEVKVPQEGLEEAIAWRAYTIHAIKERKMDEEDFYPNVTKAYRKGKFGRRPMNRFFENQFVSTVPDGRKFRITRKKIGILQRREEAIWTLSRIREFFGRPILTILELGNCYGGGLSMYHQLLGHGGALIGVDSEVSGVKVKKAELEKIVSPCKLTLIKGDSTDRSTLENVKKALDGRTIDVLGIDTRHYEETSKKEFEMYRGLLSLPSVVVFHDIGEKLGVHKESERTTRDYWNSIKSHFSYEEKRILTRAGANGVGLLFLTR